MDAGPEEFVYYISKFDSKKMYELNYNELILFSDCESLIRKMLVRDTSKRFTLQMVQKHHWMQAELPQPSSSAVSLAAILSKKLGDIQEISDNRKQNLKSKKLNEQVLRVMQSLGIDPNRTSEVRISRFSFHIQSNLVMMNFIMYNKTRS